jgi:predicted ATPase
MSLVVFRSLNWTFKYGFCDSSPPTIATAGIILTGILDDIQGGSLYGQRAIDLLSQTPSKSTAARTMFCVYALLFPWTQPLTSQLEPLLDAYDVGLHKG